MSREIKFRAWDKRGKKYLNNAQNIWMNNTCFGDLLASPNFEIEQYTGLKDANGKEIYEGDLLKIKYPFSDNDEICEVKWSNSDAGFIIGNFQFWKVVPKSVVVGNVHEDKDLLEADK